MVGITLRKPRTVQAPKVTVALVGRELPGYENPSLRYLAGALANVGHRAVVVPLGGPSSLPIAAARIFEVHSEIVGLSMPDADITIDALDVLSMAVYPGTQAHETCCAKGE